MLLYIEYGILFINTVDTKIKAHNAMLLCIEYGILFVNTVDTKIKACNALNAMFVEDCQYEVHPVFEVFYSKQRECMCFQ